MEVPRNWRLKQQRYAMVGALCPHCDAKIFPPREVCPQCGLESKAPSFFREQMGAVAIPVMEEVHRRV